MTGHTHSRNTRGITHEALCAFSGKGITNHRQKCNSQRGSRVGIPAHGLASARSEVSIAALVFAKHARPVRAIREKAA